MFVGFSAYQRLSITSCQSSLIPTAVKATAKEAGDYMQIDQVKVDRENIYKLGTLFATNLEEHVFFALIQQGKDLLGGLNSFVDRVTLALSLAFVLLVHFRAMNLIKKLALIFLVFFQEKGDCLISLLSLSPGYKVIFNF